MYPKHTARPFSSHSSHLSSSLAFDNEKNHTPGDRESSFYLNSFAAIPRSRNARAPLYPALPLKKQFKETACDK